MAKRTGAPTIRWVSIRLCRLVTKYQGVLLIAYPDAAALHAALAAALTACAALRAELDKVIPIGD